MTGNPLIDKILASINIVGMLAVLSVFVYTEFLFEPTPPNNADEFSLLQQDTREETQIDLFKLEKLTVNLYSRTTRLRFLDVEVHILPFKNTHLDILKENKALLMDIVIKISGEMEAEEVNTVAGKILLENRIKERFNNTIGKPVIKKLFFSTMVVS